jgi:hypothetical protein
MALGGWAITESCLKWMVANVPAGSKVLEFGSGDGTAEMTKHFIMTSIEQDLKWVDKYDSRYIYAPIHDKNWYDWLDLEIGEIQDDYALILIDGPYNPMVSNTIAEDIVINARQDNARHGIQDYYLAHPTLFDDTNRENDRLICDWFISQGFEHIVSIADPNCPNKKQFTVVRKNVNH